MPAVSETKYVVQAGWDHAPHLSADDKRKELAKTPPYLRAARSKGEPSLGAGAIFPIEQSHYIIDPFPLPPHWRKSFGLDVGWNKTAAIWTAIDDDTDTAYAYSEHYRGEEKPVVHASAIKARGEWIPGVIDPAARGRSQYDGERLMAQYLQEGLSLVMADNSVEAGIYEIWTRLEQGRLKIFSTLPNLLLEMRGYHRKVGENGTSKIVKKRDHAIDALRYDVMSGLKRAIVRPLKDIVSNQRIIADGVGGY